MSESSSDAPTPGTGAEAAAFGSGGIVVGVDGSAQSESALRWAVRQAGLTGQVVHAVISWDYPVDFGAAPVSEPDWRDDSAAVLRKTIEEVLSDDDARRVQQHVVQGHPVTVLMDAAADADLLVVGSRGHGGFAGMLLGSVSQHVVAHAPCPVVVVHEQRARSAASAT